MKPFSSCVCTYPPAWLVLALNTALMPSDARAQEPPPDAPTQELSRAVPVPEAPPAPEPELTGRIERIDIEGNERTQEVVILRALRIQAGELLTAGATEELKRRLLNLKLFEHVEVRTRQEGDGVALRIKVEERWTLLPIPMFTSSNGQWQAGLFLLESNVFGLHKLFVLGAMAGNRGGNVFSLYKDPGIRGSRWTGTLFAQYAKLDRERRVRDIVVDEYTDRRLDVSGVLGHQLTPELNVGAGLFGIFNRPLRANEDEPAPERSHAQGVSAVAEYLGQDFHFFFNEGLFARLNLRQGFDLGSGSRDYRQATLTAAYTHALFGNHALTLSGTLDYVDGDSTLDAVLLGQRTGTRGFTLATLWAEQAAIATLEYQVPLWSPSLATFTAHAFIDAGHVEWRNTVTRYVAPGAGLRMYLRSVAVPALGLDVTRAPQTRELVVSFAAGLSM
ncbi:POTRA domain-containing protein [Myxococcus fulvus]|uniref:POTRA domain-containing protein n=1 Tax=Myxococcus fulvus TaxID=33 RepID=UPI00200AF718|nr:POTRA domain-containing protein [Myxococcus fulvus]MCK8503734.1 BamA/TamA family outer membrane protein [Myxococcus fulvus]